MKVRNFILMVFICILICIAVPYWYISYNSSNYKVISNTTLDNEVEKISENKVSNAYIRIEETTTTSISEQTTSTDAKITQSTPTTTSQPKEVSKPAIIEKQPSPNKDNLEKSIIAKYESQFLSLKNNSLNALNTLLYKAKSEYNSIPKNKRVQERVSLGLKYLELGKSLESGCDNRFYSLLSEMESELKNNSLPCDAVTDAEKRYESEKKERRSNLLSKVFK